MKNQYSISLPLQKTCFKLLLFFVFTLVWATATIAQEIPVNQALLKQKWTAQWITCPNVPQRAYGVYHFRKQIQLTTKPAKFIVHLSADNRYRFFVNGKPVCYGPARGDLYNWYYESIDISPFLQAGDNTLAAIVWNMGEHATVSQISNQTAFVLQGDGVDEQLINTNSTWKVYANKAYSPCSMDNGPRLKTYMVIGPGDHVKAKDYPWNWEQPYFDDAKWLKAEKVAFPEPLGFGTDNRWTMVPRNIPLMQETQQRFSKVRRVSGITVEDDFLAGKKPLTIPANKKISILIDQSVNTLAYPQLLVSRGKGAKITLTYAEALFENGLKGNRNEIEGKEIMGNFDIFEPDGLPKRLFRPLWQRTYRYVQLDIATAAQPLVINDFYGMYTGYPFVEQASFTSNDASLKEIWDVGWRTARLCAGETYYDCPYYEQLQYVGDTRIQALISLYVSGDDRLMRKAINDFYNSRVPEGLTQGRYPSNRLQVIPPFSLYWVSMLHDFMMHRKDDQFLKRYLIAVDGILNWYKERIDAEKGMLGPMKWWNFTDWSNGFSDMGVPAGATDGNSAILTLQYVYTLKQAAELYQHFGLADKAAACIKLADQLNAGTRTNCFSASKGLFSDTPEKKSFSQHVNIMAVLAGTVSNAEAREVMAKVLTDPGLLKATFYYRFYLNQALKAADLGKLYYSELKPWRDMLKAGLTTFAESPDPSRSDCHAWSASPNYDFLATLCGITPSSPGFETVLIKPEPGELLNVTGRMPSPKGEITVSIERKGEKDAQFVVDLPKGLTGVLVWMGKQTNLVAGHNSFDFQIQSGFRPSNNEKLPKRVLILGNSMTIHGPKAEIGWYGNWGMAASAQDKDFVHLLMQRFKKIDENIQLDFKNIADYERNYWAYNLSALDSLLNLNPDLVVLRISENVDQLKVEENNLVYHYGKLIDHIRAKNPKAIILNAASFWDRPAVTKAIVAASDLKGAEFLNLSKLSEEPKNMALGQFKNKGVAMHPSDQGMLAIADAIWNAMLKIYPGLGMDRLKKVPLE